MSKIVFFCIPAQGHTNPTLGVVRELVSRGHEVYYYSYNMLRERIEEAGAKFVSCDEYDMEQKLSPADGARIGKDMAFSIKILVDTTLALDEKIKADMETLKPDCIVADSMAVWGKAAALKYGIPFVSSTTTFAFNKESAKIMKHGGTGFFELLRALPKMRRDVKRLQEKGYPIKSFLDIIANNENTETIVYTSPEFQPCAETFSDKYSFVGPSIRPCTQEIEKTKENLIYISMGTVNNDMMPLYERFIEAFADTPYQMILSAGDVVRLSDFGQLPANISVYRRVDQIAVLRKADIFFSHCGMNSVSESLYFGVPIAMLPQTSEQLGVARRTAELGAGILLENTEVQTIRHAAEKLMAEPSYKKNAEMISEGFHRCGGASAAADKILQVCGKGEKIQKNK